ncbi:PE domain-containing protein [Nocardia sp. NPDC050697]|uniref:PE domain-containing protein n=1 Tax=Nocardia sp. NPDC050697 TaxID=3155158 RepID=UPI0033E46E89
MTVDVTPEHLVVTSGNLAAAEAALSAALEAAHAATTTALAVTATPEPVMAACGALFQFFETPFAGCNEGGATYLRNGHQVLLPVSTGYETTDIAGGVSTAAAGARFGK